MIDRAALGLLITNDGVEGMLIGRQGEVLGKTRVQSANQIGELSKQFVSAKIVGVGVAAAPAPSITETIHSIGIALKAPIAGPFPPEFCLIPGCGVASPSTAIITVGDDLRFAMNSRVSAALPFVTTSAIGLLPDYVSYFATWPVIRPSLDRIATDANSTIPSLAELAAAIAPGAGDSAVTSPAIQFRAAIERAAFELKDRIESIRAAGVPVRRFVLRGEWIARCPLIGQIFSDALDERFKLPVMADHELRGAAICGALAAGPAAMGFASASSLIHAMAGQPQVRWRPDLDARRAYAEICERRCG